MTSEVIVTTGAVTQNQAPEEAANKPEVAEPESNEAQQPEQTNEQPEQGDADKSLKRLQRRVDRVTAARYQAEAEARQLREALARYQQTEAPQQEQEEVTVKPEDVERIANERAAHIAEAQQVDRRGAEITKQLLKIAGSNDAVHAIVSAVIEEAGPLVDSRTGRWTALGEALDASESPAELLSYLEKDLDAAASLRGLSAARLGRRVAAIEAEMAAKKAAPARSKAPSPLEPVKSTTAGSNEPNIKDTAAWIAWKNKQDRRI